MLRNKREYMEKGAVKLNIKGIYEIIRHPMYTNWILAFVGLAFIFDSFLSLLISPLLVILLELQAYLEEKYIFIPKYGSDKMESYKKKTPYRLFPTPYNALLIIIACLVIYIGIINFILA
jgi:protein-S-isoprenylcysteine O-methyltransferase Ste14